MPGSNVSPNCHKARNTSPVCRERAQDKGCFHHPLSPASGLRGSLPSTWSVTIVLCSPTSRGSRGRDYQGGGSPRTGWQQGRASRPHPRLACIIWSVCPAVAGYPLGTAFSAQSCCTAWQTQNSHPNKHGALGALSTWGRGSGILRTPWAPNPTLFGLLVLGATSHLSHPEGKPTVSELQTYHSKNREPVIDLLWAGTHKSLGWGGGGVCTWVLMYPCASLMSWSLLKLQEQDWWGGMWLVSLQVFPDQSSVLLISEKCRNPWWAQVKPHSAQVKSMGSWNHFCKFGAQRINMLHTFSAWRREHPGKKMRFSGQV